MASRKQERINRIWGEFYQTAKPEEPKPKPKRVYGPALDPSAPWFVNYETLRGWLPAGSQPVIFAGTPEAEERDRVQEANRKLTRPWEFDPPEAMFSSVELEEIRAATKIMLKHEGGLLKPLLYEFAQILRARLAAAPVQKKGKKKE